MILPNESNHPNTTLEGLIPRGDCALSLLRFDLRMYENYRLNASNKISTGCKAFLPVPSAI